MLSSELINNSNCRKVTTAFAFLMFLFISQIIVISASPGNLDPAFGDGGVANPQIGGALTTANKVLVQPDRKIIIAGIAASSFLFQDFALVRYYPSGLLDISFGGNGIVKTDMGSARDIIYDAALQPDGKIVVVGEVGIQYGAPFPGTAFGIARYNPDGSLDNTFNGNGKVVTLSFHYKARAVQIQSDGRIVVAGTKYNCPDCIHEIKMIIIRLNSDGSRDTSFGQVIPSITGDSETNAMAIQPDGKIIVAGFSGSSTPYAFVRLNSDGTQDTSFGNGGIVVLPGNSLGVTDLALQPDGKIIAIGTTGSSSNQDFETLRLNPNGTLDSTFGTAGRVITSITNAADKASGVVLQPDGKIIVAGYSSSKPTILVRYNTNGTLDQSFEQTSIDPAPSFAFDVALQSDGKFVTTGDELNTKRYLGDGKFVSPKTDFDFDGGGKADFAVVRNVDDAYLEWYAAKSVSLNLIFDKEWGLPSDRLAPADYDNDGKTDVAVWRPSSGTWFVIKSSDNTILYQQWGAPDDIPVPSDFDGDGKADLAVWRPESGVWYVLQSNNGNIMSEQQWGSPTDKPVIGDFDGDGRADLAVWRPVSGEWYIMRSSDGAATVKQWGAAEDILVAADYDGDGKTDMGVYRPSNGVWYLQLSTGSMREIQFGVSTDKPVPADYDGDRQTDLAVYRNGVWYLQQSSSGLRVVVFGEANDKPLATAFQY